MTFDEILNQVITLLKRQGRVSYRALKMRFDIDDEYLDVLKEELIDAQRLATDEDGRIMVWAGAMEMPEAPSQPDQITKPIVQAEPPTQVVSPPPEPPTPDAERRQLTVMFCDLADSTKLSGQLDPEDLRDVIRAYQSTSAEVIERYDGYIAQHLGDGLMVYFGWPQAHEDDAQRAVHVGLGIIAAMGQLNDRLEQEKGIRLAVRVGIHTGLVVVGEIGQGVSQEHLALGETPNIASRIEGLASSDTVAISAATYQLVQGYFDCEDLGLHSLKGVNEPQQVYCAVRASGAQSRLDVGVTRGLTPLVGREQEVGLLFERWQQAKEGQGQVVLLSGEAGIGKSRLLQVLRDHVSNEPHIRLECRSSPYYQNTALYPITDLLQRSLTWQPDDASETRLEKLEQTLQQYRLPLPETVPLFATLLSLPLPEDHYAPLTLSPQQQRQKTLESIVAMLLEHAERQPVLFILEDLHWTDPTTLELLDLMVDQAPTVALLTLLTCRPEFEPSWGLRSHLTPIALNRFTRKQIETMANRLTDGKSLPADVMHHLAEKTDGVPLYVEEMTKAIVESGVLQATNGHYELTAPLGSLSIPTTLQDSLMARLDRLGTAKSVAQLGAVLGRTFTYELLQAVSPLDELVLWQSLVELVQAELLYQRGSLPEATFTFKHALIQEMAYETLLRNARRQHHQRVAETLIEQFPEAVETQPELLAHHYTEAGMAEQAIDYWQQAGDYANRHYAYNEAIAHLQQGLAILETLPETAVRVDREIRFYLAMGPPLLAAKGNSDSEAGRVYARVRELCRYGEDLTLHASALHGLRLFYSGRAEHRQAAEIAQEALHAAQRSQHPALLARGHFHMGFSLYMLGRLHPAVDHFSQSLVYADSHQEPLTDFHQDPSLISVLGRAHAIVPLWMLGYPARALQWCQDALTRSQTFSNSSTLWTKQTILWAKQRALLLYADRRDWEILHEATKDLVAIATTYNIPQMMALGSTMLGWYRVVQGQDPEGVAQLEENVQVLKDLGNGIFYPYRLAQLAEAYAHIGRLEDGLAAVEEAFKVINATEEYLYHAELYRLKGTLILAYNANSYQKAETCFQQALDIACQQQAKSLELRAATSLARLWQSQGKRQDAYELLQPVYGWFSEGFDTADLKDAKTLLDELEEAR